MVENDIRKIEIILLDHYFPILYWNPDVFHLLFWSELKGLNIGT